MVIVEFGEFHHSDEESRIVVVFTAVDHGKNALAVVLVWERHILVSIIIDLLDGFLVFDILLFLVNAVTSAAVIVTGVSALHELTFDNSVEGAAHVVLLLFLAKDFVSTCTSAVPYEVIDRFWLIVPEVDLKGTENLRWTRPVVVVLLRRYCQEDLVRDPSPFHGFLQHFCCFVSPSLFLLLFCLFFCETLCIELFSLLLFRLFRFFRLFTCVNQLFGHLHSFLNLFYYN